MNVVKLIKSGIYNLYLSLKRFPYALSFSTLTTIIIIILVNITRKYNPETIDILERTAMVLALGFPLYLSIKVIFEKMTDTRKLFKIITRLAAAVLLTGYYFFLLKDINMVSTSRYIAVSLALYLFFLVIPYFYKRENFELYVVKIFSRLSTTLIYSLVLYSGLSMTLFTINKLLNIPVRSELYVSTWFVVIGIFAPIFLLAGIPDKNKNISSREYPRLFEILLLYIVMPLITVYTSILYIYFIKILISRQWPEGLVAHLVLWYASISIIVLFFISPLRQKNKWVNSFISWLPISIIPLLLMMFTAIGIRINTYGITENRYFVVLLGLWSIGIMFYYILSRKRKNIILPLSLAVIALLSVFGPWSSYSISINSQNKRFEKVIRKYDMIEDNTIIKGKEKISEDDQVEVNAILRYFEQYHRLEDLSYLPDNFNTKNTEDLFGFPYKTNRYNYNKYDYFSYNLNNNSRVISVKDYDYLFTISNYNKITQTDSGLIIKFNDLNKEISILHNDKIIYNEPLSPVLEKIHLNNKGIAHNKLNPENFVFTDNNKNLHLKIIFTTVTGTSEKSSPDNININNVNFYLLIGLKQ